MKPSELCGLSVSGSDPSFLRPVTVREAREDGEGVGSDLIVVKWATDTVD